MLAALAGTACSDIADLGSPPVVDAAASDDADTRKSADAGPGGRDATASMDSGSDAIADASPTEAGTLEAAATPGRGSLDPSFGAAGIVMLQPPYVSIGSHGVAVQPDGRIVYCGNFPSDTYMAYVSVVGRLSSDGGPDGTFAYTGQVTAAQSEYADEVCGQVTFVPDTDAIVISGFTDVYSSGPPPHMMFASRYTSQGAVDTTFAGTGFVALADNGVDSKAYGMALQPDDNLVLSGFEGPGGATARLTAGGQPDPTFDPATDAGPIGINVYPNLGVVGTIVPTSGRLVGGIAGMPDFEVVGISQTGALDRSFGDGGLATQAVEAPLTGGPDLVALPGGSIVCAASTANSIELAAFAADGGVETSFGAQGRVTVPSPLSVAGIARLSDGSFAVALEGTGTSIGVARFTAQGKIDTGFGPNGNGISVVPVYTYGGLGIAIDPQGRIILAVGTDSALDIMRMLP